MTEEDFLKRWSRRKREVAEAEKPAPPVTEARDVTGRAADQDTVKPETEFDPATLPPIESITAISDITAFLRAGVPADLTRAALRRVWTADPSIRDFVGLAENAWDFTDPNAMPGFGPLEATDDVKRMIAQVVDQIGQSAQTASDDPPVSETHVSENTSDPKSVTPENARPDESSAALSPPDQVDENPAQVLSTQVSLQSNKEDTAVQRDVTEVPDKSEQSSRRSHGRALPQ
jgi:hypothetical protein